MCLMAGYEPLSAAHNLTQTVVASEEEVLATLDGSLGWNFTRFLQVLYNNSTAPATGIATGLANAFDAGYTASTPNWETISAVNMNGFSAVDAAVSQLANALANTSTPNVSAVATDLRCTALGMRERAVSNAPGCLDFVTLSLAQYDSLQKQSRVDSALLT